MLQSLLKTADQLKIKGLCEVPESREGSASVSLSSPPPINHINNNNNNNNNNHQSSRDHQNSSSRLNFTKLKRHHSKYKRQRTTLDTKSSSTDTKNFDKYKEEEKNEQDNTSNFNFIRENKEVIFISPILFFLKNIFILFLFFVFKSLKKI